jgi:hypothetical protein
MSSLVALESGQQVDFVHLRKILNLTDGNLGAHLSKLEDAAYVKIEKTFIEQHTTALKEIIGGS